MRTEAESILYGHPQRLPHTSLLFKIKVSSVKTWAYCIYPTDGLSFSFNETCPKCMGLSSCSFPRISQSHIFLGIQGESLLAWEPPPPSQHGQTCVAAPRHLREISFSLKPLRRVPLLIFLPASSPSTSLTALVLVAWNLIACEYQVGTWTCICVHVCARILRPLNNKNQKSL